MPIDDRLRASMRRAAGDAEPTNGAWDEIERGVERRRRRATATRVGGGAVVALVFVGALAWAGLALRGERHEAAPPETTLVVSGVKVYPSNPTGPGVAKLSGSVENMSSDPSGAEVACSLRGASGDEVATTSIEVRYIEPHRTVSFGGGTSYETPPVAATCDATPRTAVSPPPQQTPTPRFQAGGAALFDADHGIAVGAYGSPGCESGCTGLIETTSDGGATWSVAEKTGNPVVSVTVSGTSDAWAVENRPCAYICPTLLHSSDGGGTWSELSEANIVHPSFPSPAVGFGFEYVRTLMTSPLMKTTDGGRTWTRIGPGCSGPTDWGAFASFVTPSHGWILCNGQPSAGSQSRTLLETTDGGLTWTNVGGGLGDNGYPEALFFRPDGHGWIGLGNAVITIMRSTDGGRLWTSPITIDANGGDLRSLWFLDDNVGYAVVSVAGSPADRLIATRDGGDHWRTVSLWQASS